LGHESVPGVTSFAGSSSCADKHAAHATSSRNFFKADPPNPKIGIYCALAARFSGDSPYERTPEAIPGAGRNHITKAKVAMVEQPTQNGGIFFLGLAKSAQFLLRC